MKILVTGANGQLGSELNILSSFYPEHNWVFTDINELDISDLNNLELNINLIKPDLIINCAAYTNVDKAETERELAMSINFSAVDILSKWSAFNNSKLIHISTDYVFDGNSSTPITENAKTNPINFYGLTKLKGEKICLKNDFNSIVIRTSWVYSSFGRNFVKTMLNLMSEKDNLNVINDQIGSPTYAKDLAKIIVKIINYKDWIPGLYQYSNEGEISWFDFANSIKKIAGYSTEINPISSSDFLTQAKRPSYSLLDKSKIKNTFGITIPKYETSLENCIKILKNEK